MPPMEVPSSLSPTSSRRRDVPDELGLRTNNRTSAANHKQKERGEEDVEKVQLLPLGTSDRKSFFAITLQKRQALARLLGLSLSHKRLIGLLTGVGMLLLGWVVFISMGSSYGQLSTRSHRSPECRVYGGDHTAMALDVIDVWNGAEKRKPRILCLVFTTNKENHARAKRIKETWGADCDRLLFISNETDPALPTVKTQQSVPDTYKNLHYKVIWAFHYAWERYREEFDWIYKADDDAYVIVDNLRKLLLSQRYAQLPSSPKYTGRRFALPSSSHIYTSGGAGYVMNKAALQKLVQEGFPSHSEIESKGKCKLGNGNWPFGMDNCPEDLLIGWCLSKLLIYPEDSRDEDMRERFHWYNPAGHYSLSYEDTPVNWHVRYTKPFGIYHTNGQDYFSNSSISFHYVSNPELMNKIHTRLTRCNRAQQGGAGSSNSRR